jgi:hypothetical protein
MAIELVSFPPVKIPAQVDMIISLIREEIKSRAFSRSLTKADHDPFISYTPLGDLILSLIGFTEISDELFELYIGQLDYYAAKANVVDNKELSDLAFSFYIDLEIEKRS